MTTLATTKDDNGWDDDSLSQDERLDRNLLEMEILYRSRCVQMPSTPNVKVVEIDPKK